MLLRIACKKWSQIYHTTSRGCLNRTQKLLASLCDSLIFLGILVRDSFLDNMCIVTDQLSEAEIESIAPNYMPEVVSDSSYEFKKMLELCLQVAS